MTKKKSFEMEDCECGHRVPLPMVHYDKEGCGTCSDCVIANLEATIKKQRKKIKRYKSLAVFAAKNTSL